MASTISDTDLAKNLSDILNRIHAEGEQFIIERDGEPVATLAPLGVTAPITMRELAAQLRHLPPPGEGFADDLELVQRSQPLADDPAWRS